LKLHLRTLSVVASLDHSHSTLLALLTAAEDYQATLDCLHLHLERQQQQQVRIRSLLEMAELARFKRTRFL
jgi:hypothetical protein